LRKEGYRIYRSYRSNRTEGKYQEGKGLGKIFFWFIFTSSLLRIPKLGLSLFLSFLFYLVFTACASFVSPASNLIV
jgi:hypothetical protein